ncbi:MAG TPA: glycoside hydrolase family 65 protein [Bacteroides reticulotermitis]|nr:glycoside hydrolase family 65 protein [Bacteroides reticulotermitis]
MRKILFLLLLLGGFQFSKAEEKLNLWQLTTTDAQSLYVGTPMANGGIGILPWREPFSVRHVILNHVFDADRERGVSRVLKGINPFLMTLKVDGNAIGSDNISQWKQTINMKEAFHLSEFIADGKAEISYSLCALRNMPYAGLIRVTVKALQDISLHVGTHMDIPGEYASGTREFHDTESDGIKVYMLHAYASTPWRKQQVASSSAFLFEQGKEIIPTFNDSSKELCFSAGLKKNEEITFALVGSICSSRDFIDPCNEAEREIIYAHHEGINSLLAAHTRLWNELWQGDILIEGDDEAQQAVRFALFNLYSSCREGNGLSISPMGLSSQDYNGHIFWDTEIWMFPPVLLLNQGLAESMMNYRIDRLPAARQKAMSYGYRGAMYPWESDDAGEEATPTTALTGPFEHHITADIGIACWNYYCVTRDKEWLKNKGYPLLKAVADFWSSRAIANNDGTWSINNVVGANEYKHGATDNAFTNASAKLALQYAAKAATVCGTKANKQWEIVANGLKIHRMPDGVTQEHATYNGEMIKQADVNLLGYPLGIITDKGQLRKDLAYYTGKIDPQHGPAMSFAVFCVQYARMGDPDKAYEMFLRSYQPNQRPPFGVLAETPTSNNPYFMTGAGGLLQTVINGFCGLQITDKGIIQLPAVLPKHWKKVTIKGVGNDRKVYVNQQK